MNSTAPGLRNRINPLPLRIFRLSDILSICRNLTSIVYSVDQASEKDDTYTVSSLNYTTSLETIEVLRPINATGHIDSNKLQPIFELSPRLRKISLMGFNMNALSVIFQHCPNLEILDMNNRQFSDSGFVDHILKPVSLSKRNDDDNNNDGRGLRSLVLHDISTLDPGIPLLFQKYQSTIERLQLNGLHYFPSERLSMPDHYWRFFSSLTMINLTDLSISPGVIGNMYPHVSPLLQQCRMSLRRLCLYNFNSSSLRSINTEIVDLLSTTVGENLEKLVLQNFRLYKGTKMFQKLRQKEKLTHLVLSHCENSSDVVLRTAASISSLIEVTFVGGTGSYHRGSNLSLSGMRQVCIELAKLPKLERLFLMENPVIDDNAFVGFKNNTTLKLMVLSLLTNVSPQYVTSILPSHIIQNYSLCAPDMDDLYF